MNEKSLKRVEKEKGDVVENLSTLRGHYNVLQDQLTLTIVTILYCFLIHFLPGSRHLVSIYSSH